MDGKVKSVVKGTVTYAFEYNGLGNRIAKKEVKPGLITTTYYAPDAPGNVLGVYEEKFKPKETDLQNDLLLNSYNVNSVALKRAINNIFITSDGSSASVGANGNLTLQAGSSITLKNFTAVQGSTFLTQITPVQANNNESELALKEHHIFGSSRLGLEAKNLIVYTSSNTSTTIDAVPTNFLSLIGDKRFELSNHLGNVLAVVSDKKIPTATAGVFNADVLSFSDYYPFGMLVPNRHEDSKDYRYGFNGKENDNEIMGEGNFQDYGMRMYNPRIGRFFNVDPLTEKYPELTPYQFASNTPIWAVDLDGLEAGIATVYWNALKGYWNSPASAKSKQSIRYQVNYTQSQDLSENSMDNLTKGEFFTMSLGLAMLRYAQSTPGNIKFPRRNIHVNSDAPHTPKVDIEIGHSTPKLKTKITNQVEITTPVEKNSSVVSRFRIKRINGEAIGDATAIGRMEDLKKYDNAINVDTWRKSGRMPSRDGGGVVTWAENRKWLQDRINRGDTFIMTMNPQKLPTEYVPNQPNGWFTKMEYDYLVKNRANIIYDYKQSK